MSFTFRTFQKKSNKEPYAPNGIRWNRNIHVWEWEEPGETALQSWEAAALFQKAQIRPQA